MHDLRCHSGAVWHLTLDDYVGFLLEEVSGKCTLTPVPDLASGGGKAMAGAGTKTPIRDVSRLVKEYGGKASDWAKVTSRSRVASDGTRFETHAYRNVKTNELVEPKMKLQR